MKIKSKSSFQEVFKDFIPAKRRMNIQKNIKTNNNLIKKNKEIIDHVTTTEYMNFLNKIRADFLNKQKEKEEFYKNMNIMKEKKRKEYLKNFYTEMIKNTPSTFLDMGMVDMYKLNIFKNKLINKKNNSRPATAKATSRRYMTEFDNSIKYKLKTTNDKIEKSKKTVNISSNICKTEYNDVGIDFDLISEYAFEKKKLENKMKELNKINKKNKENYSQTKKNKPTKLLLKSFSAKNLSSFFSNEKTAKTNSSFDITNVNNNKNLRYQSNKEILLKSKLNIYEPIFQTNFPLETTPSTNRIKTDINDINNTETKLRLIKENVIITGIQNCKYVPLKNRYKEIIFHKNCIFNNEFLPPKRKKSNLKTTKCLQIRKNEIIKKQHIREISKNPIKANCQEQKIIKDKSNIILRNLNEIGSVMKMDKNYTNNSINKYVLKRKKKLNKEDLFMKNEVEKNIKFDYFLKNKERINKDRKGVFINLKKCLNEDKETEKKTQFIREIKRKLGKYYKEEKKDKMVKKQVLDQHYNFRREENREEHKEMKNVIKSMEKKLRIIDWLGDQIDLENKNNKKQNINKKVRPKSANKYFKKP